MDKNIKKLLEKFLVDFQEGALEEGKVFRLTKKNFEEELEEISSFVKKTFPDNLLNSVLYLLGELIDNINQHSDYSQGLIFLNYNKNANKIIIIISDNGISIPGGFEKGNIFFENDSQAIQMAINGKSTKKEEGRGFGLPSSKKLVEKGFKGNFILASRNGFYPENTKILDEINGTLVCLIFSDNGQGLNIYDYIG